MKSALHGSKTIPNSAALPVGAMWTPQEIFPERVVSHQDDINFGYHENHRWDYTATDDKMIHDNVMRLQYWKQIGLETAPLDRLIRDQPQLFERANLIVDSYRECRFCGKFN